MQEQIDILLIEDEGAHVALIRRAFDAYNEHVKLDVTNNLREARLHMNQTAPNLIIADLRLPDGNGADILPIDYPVIIMTSHGDEQVAVEAMKAGALDYVVKSEATLAEMPRIAERALREWGHILERKQAEEALRESEERFRRIFAHSPLGMGVINENLCLMNVNARLCHMTGHTENELIGRRLPEFVHPSDYAHNLYLAEQLFEAKTPSLTVELRFLKKGGETIWGRMTASTIYDAEGNVLYGLIMVEDITERRRMEREILEISNREKRRIGQDLHDELGQLLTGICFRIVELETDLTKNNQPEARDASEIVDLVQTAILQSRAMAWGLNPVSLETGGLWNALTSLGRSIEQIYEIPCTLTCPKPVIIPDNETATHVYRIAQEALNNAIKHGKASHLSVSLEQYGSIITLTVQDNGIGLPENQGPHEGMGLRNMHYRAAMIHGSLEIKSSTGGGTLVRCQFTTDPEGQPGFGLQNR